ncbi:globin-coupled sensor protein [Paenibacillus aestuarii]|uniref:Globin-coupled sensor protein n=1 Tax=Paenibacillus aestuarii TaxID=516965 RepID=A0ABW0KCE6_9BACL|nr:globin-coupled sensor protein [Paenibacillus aestuarii]
MSLKDPEIMMQLKMIELTDEEIRIAKYFQPIIREHSEEIVDSFYKSVLEVEKLKQLIQEHSTIERLKKTLELHLIEIFSGQFDAQFLEKRTQVAMIHFRIGLDPKWYLSAFQNLLNASLGVVLRRVEDREESMRISTVVTKLFNFEQQLVLDAYEKETLYQREIEYQKKENLVKQIIGTSTNLAELTLETSSSVKELIATSNEVNTKVQRSAEKTRDTQRIAAEGELRIAKLESSIESMDTSTSEMSDVVSRLNESATHIREVINIVNEIAGQTNLLALNSAIEAARAGEHGRGFAVVSSEVRKLSDQTKQSVEQIQKLVDQTSKYSSEVASAILSVQQLVKNGLAESQVTREAFTEIMDSMNMNIAEVGQVEQEIKELVYVIEEIGQATQKVAASSEALNDSAKSI